MTDLDQAIRAVLADHHQYDGLDAASALLAVLDLHPTEAHECPGGQDNYGQITAYDVTCPTLLAIAEKLGVEHD